MFGKLISDRDCMLRLFVCVFLSVAVVSPYCSIDASAQRKKVAVRQRTKKKGSPKSTQSTQSKQASSKNETPIDAPATPVIHPEEVLPEAIGGQCLACINNPGVCAACNGSGKMRVTTLENGTRYVPCDKCNGTKVCSVCHGKSSAAQSQATDAVSSRQSEPSSAIRPTPSVSSQASVYSPSVSSYESLSVSSGGSWKDHTTRGSVQDLMRYMQSKPGAGGTVIMPKRASMEHSYNGIYLYFVQPDHGAPGELRMRIQYYADAPQNFRDLEFDVSNHTFNYHVNSPQRGKSGKYYWEYSDQQVAAGDRPLIYALESCRWTQVYYLGPTPNAIKHRKTLSDEDLRDIERVITLYRLSGGSF